MADQLWYVREPGERFGHPCEVMTVWAADTPDPPRRGAVRFTWLFPAADLVPPPLVEMSERLYDLTKAVDVLATLLLSMPADAKRFSPADLTAMLEGLQALPAVPAPAAAAQ